MLITTTTIINIITIVTIITVIAMTITAILTTIISKGDAGTPGEMLGTAREQTMP